MKLLLIVPAFPKLSETFIVNQFLGLIARGWDVHIVCEQSDAMEWQYFPGLSAHKSRVHQTWPHRNFGVSAFLFPWALLDCVIRNRVGLVQYLKIGYQRLGWSVLRRFYLDARIIALVPDLIHFEFGAIAVERTYLKAFLNCQLTVSFRGYGLNYVGLDRSDYYLPVWQAADGIHLLGQDLYRRALKRGCPEEIKPVLIPPAIDVNKFAPGEREITVDVGGPTRPLRLLSVGRVEWKKGYPYAIQAVKKLVERGYTVEYRIIGTGSAWTETFFEIVNLGLSGVIQLLGAQPHPVVIEAMRWADLFLHPAVSEGFSNAVLEAQAMELPVVCSDADGLSENVQHGMTGFVVPRRDPVALADAIEAIILDPVLQRRMGAAGRSRVRTYFNLEDQNAAFDEFFKGVLAGRDA